MNQWTIQWHDSGRAPQCAPDPAFPQGIDLDLSGGAVARCKTALPYPARRCGIYTLRCRRCGISVGVTTAGRVDDPRSVTVACKQLQ
jgi:hypothetical protein